MNIHLNRGSAFCGLLRALTFTLTVPLSASLASAQTADQQHFTNSDTLPTLPDHVFSGERSRDILSAQIMLDRAHFSPGVLDGLTGGNTARAVKAWQRSQNMKPTGLVDVALLSSLEKAASGPLVMHYQIVDSDVEGPFGALPNGMEAMSKLESAHYESAVEALAEKFHMSEDLLRALNPSADLAIAGSNITVIAIEATPLKQDVARIEIDSADASLRAFAADGQLLASFPATVGSADFPSPSGTMAVRAIAPAPAYYFSPEGRSWGPDKKLTIAPGPNNPVGSTWIDLTKEGYGIHGTPDPQLIGKTASHGCVRLTNWDAETLAKAVKRGASVEFL